MPERQRDRERRAPPDLALDRDRPAVQPHQLLHQRQPDARCPRASGPAALDAVEALEQARQLALGDAAAGVAHRQLGRPAAVAAQRDRDPALERELEGVGEEVEDDLLPHLAVDVDRLRQRRAVDGEPQARALAGRAEARSPARP